MERLNSFATCSWCHLVDYNDMLEKKTFLKRFIWHLLMGKTNWPSILGFLLYAIKYCESYTCKKATRSDA